MVLIVCKAVGSLNSEFFRIKHFLSYCRKPNALKSYQLRMIQHFSTLFLWTASFDQGHRGGYIALLRGLTFKPCQQSYPLFIKYIFCFNITHSFAFKEVLGRYINYGINKTALFSSWLRFLLLCSHLNAFPLFKV